MEERVHGKAMAARAKSRLQIKLSSDSIKLSFRFNHYCTALLDSKTLIVVRDFLSMIFFPLLLVE